jgi:hypothetical protein
VPRERIATGLYPLDVKAWQERARASEADARALRQSLDTQRAGKKAWIVLALADGTDAGDPLTLLQGFVRFSRAQPTAQLVMVGDGPLRGEIEAKVASLGLAQRVHRVGDVPSKDLPRYYGAADVFVHVPRFEPWGSRVSEAMACGLPVIAATSVSSAADLVIPGRTGALVNPGDPESLATALGEIFGADRTALRTAALERVQRVDVNAAAQALEDLVERLNAATPLGRFRPLAQVMRWSTRNVWGLWSTAGSREGNR